MFTGSPIGITVSLDRILIILPNLNRIRILKLFADWIWTRFGFLMHVKFSNFDRKM